MHQGLGIALVALVLAAAFGGYRAYADGRFRGTRAVRGAGPDQAAPPDGAAAGAAEAPPSVLDGAGVDHVLGERATLLQFSSAFCAPCRATRRVLADVAAIVPGVEHVEVDAEQHLELVRRVGVLRTPTTLVLDAAGREVSRAAGALRKEQVLVALAAVVPDR